MHLVPASQAPKETGQALLEAAIFCFAENGFEGASIRAIAQRAGKQVSLIGYHFGNKEGLYLKCFQYIFLRYPGTEIDPAYRDLDAIRKDRNLAARALRAEIHCMVQDLFGNADEPLAQASIRMFMMEMQSPRPILHELYRERVSGSLQLIKACLASLQPGISDDEVVFLGQCIHGQCLIQRLATGLNSILWKSSLPSFSPAALADRIADFVLPGLGVTK